VLIMSGVPAANYWSRAITEDAVPEESRDDFRRALALDEEGFGQLDDAQNWNIVPLVERIREL
jgi:hypothetical protein